MEQFILKSIRIMNLFIFILLCFLCAPAFFLFTAHLIDGSPTKLDTFFILTVPFFLLAIFLKIRTKLKKKEGLSNFSIIDYFLIFILIIGFVFLIRVTYIYFHPINLFHGGRHINLSIEHYWATAGGGPSIKFFGGVKKNMSFSILDGHKVLWQFATEVYPHTLNWRGSSITFDDNNKTVIFEHGNRLFGRIILVTPNIITISGAKKFKNQSKKISKSPNGKFRASVQSKNNKMEFFVTDSNQNILWRCEMINCSTIIDWKNGNIIWDDGPGTVIYEYESSGDSHINKFYFRTPPIFEYENKPSFVN